MRKLSAAVLVLALTAPFGLFTDSAPPAAATHTEEPSPFTGGWSWDDGLDAQGNAFGIAANRIDDSLDALLASGSTDRVHVFINFVGPASDAYVDGFGRRFGAEKLYKFYMLPAARATVPLAAVPAIAAEPGVWGVEQAPVLTMDMAIAARATQARGGSPAANNPNPYADFVWLNPIGATAGGAYGFRGEGMVIAVLDTGIDDKHVGLDDLDDDPATLDPKVIAGADISSGVPAEVNPEDDVLHGTHVAGIAAGTGRGTPIGVACQCLSNNNAGVAPQANLVDIKIDTGGADVVGAIAVGFDWVARYNAGLTRYGAPGANRIDVATLSFGCLGCTGPGDDLSSRAINELVRHHVVVTVSAGNSGDGAFTVSTPGVADGAITVANVNIESPEPDPPTGPTRTLTRNDDRIADSSSRGPRPDDGDANSVDELKPTLGAPGEFIFAPLMRSGIHYVGLSGTSMAAPHVAGTAALMLQANPGLVPFGPGLAPGEHLVRDVMVQTAQYLTATNGAPVQFVANGMFDQPWNNAWGHGYVNAFAAVTQALATPVPGLSVVVDDETAAVGQLVTLRATAIGGAAPYDYQFAWDLDDDGAFDDATGDRVERVFPKGANDVAVRVTDGLASATDAAVVTVTTSVLFCDDFENGPGMWGVSIDGTGPGAADLWQDVHLIGSGGAVVLIVAQGNGGGWMFAGTPLSAEAAPVTYEDGVDTSLLSPPVDLARAEAPILLAYSLGGASLANEALDVDLLVGGVWTTVASHTGHVVARGPSGENLFRVTDFALDLSGYAGQPVTQVRFRFHAPVDDDPAIVGGWNLDDVCLTVNNIRSVASFTVGPDAPTALDTLTFTDTSTDPDSTIVSRTWDFGDGSPLASGAVVTHRYADNGNYLVTLSVASADGDTDSITQQVTVRNLAPTPGFTVNPIAPRAGSSVRFTSTASDADGTVASVLWSFGDGGTGSGPTVSRTYARGGFYNVVQTVTDNDGAVSVKSISLAVCEPGVRPVVGPGLSVRLDSCIGI